MSLGRDRMRVVAVLSVDALRYFPETLSSSLSDVQFHPTCSRATDGYVPVDRRENLLEFHHQKTTLKFRNSNFPIFPFIADKQQQWGIFMTSKRKRKRENWISTEFFSQILCLLLILWWWKDANNDELQNGREKVYFNHEKTRVLVSKERKLKTSLFTEFFSVLCWRRVESEFWNFFILQQTKEATKVEFSLKWRGRDGDRSQQNKALKLNGEKKYSR